MRYSTCLLTSWKSLVFILVLGCLFGCSGDGITDLIPKVPIITIEKLRSEKVVDEDLEDRIEFVGEEIWWRLNANPPPKADLVVKIETSRGKKYVVIPKHQKHSEEFSNITVFGIAPRVVIRTADPDARQQLLEDAEEESIEIVPLPTVSIVGEGEVVNLEKLYLPEESLGGHIIPEDFNFPLYEIGDPSEILLPRVHEVKLQLPASFVEAIPPSGSVITNGDIIIVTFDEEPIDLRISYTVRGGIGGEIVRRGKKIEIHGPFRPDFWLEDSYDLRFRWREGDLTLSYTVQ